MKNTAALSLTLILAGLSGSAALADDPASAPVESAGPAAEPGTRAKIIEVSEYATVRRVRGICHLIRGDEVSPSLKIGEVLMPGDILDLGTDGVLTLAIGGHKTARLDAGHSRYFRIEKR
jgi:hypothetical protein